MPSRFVVLAWSWWIGLATPLAAQWADGSAAARRLTAARVAPPATTAAFLELFVPALMEEFPTPGVTVALIRREAPPEVLNFGVADVASAEPVTDSTLFTVASVSKMLTAIGVMRLVEAGQVALDAPVSRYLVRWSLPRSRFDESRVTVERVLSHNAGLAAGGGPEYTPDEELPTLVEALGGRNKLGEPVHLVAEPGSAPRYSNGGYMLLQLLLEDVSGEPFERYMRLDVLEPLGMRQSSFVDPARPEIAARLATPYDWRLNPVPFGRLPAAGVGGLHTTASDLARLVAVELEAAAGVEQVPVLRGESFRRMQRAARTGPFGLGHVVREASGVALVGHTGLIVGWNAALEMAPARGRGIVVLTNGDNGSYVHQAIVEAWARLELGVTTPSANVPARKRVNRLLGVLGGQRESGALSDEAFRRIADPLEQAETAIGVRPVAEIEQLLRAAEAAVPAGRMEQLGGHFAGIRDWLRAL